MEKPEKFDINELIEYLQGTSMSLDEAISDLYKDCDSTILSAADHNEIDNSIFQCEDCGWWYDLSERSEDEPSKCVDCVG